MPLIYDQHGDVFDHVHDANLDLEYVCMLKLHE